MAEANDIIENFDGRLEYKDKYGESCMIGWSVETKQRPGMPKRLTKMRIVKNTYVQYSFNDKQIGQSALKTMMLPKDIRNVYQMLLDLYN